MGFGGFDVCVRERERGSDLSANPAICLMGFRLLQSTVLMPSRMCFKS